MAESLPKLKNKVWKKQLTHPLHKWHMHQLSSNDCGPFCVAMAANALRDTLVFDAQTLARAMEEGGQGHLIPSRITGWATFPWGVVRALKGTGFDAHWRIAAQPEQLQRNLDGDVVSIVVVGAPFAFRDGRWAGWSHYKIVYAWNPEDGWAFVDPAAAEEQIYSFQSDEDFLKQWTAMGRILIEVREPEGEP